LTTNPDDDVQIRLKTRFIQKSLYKIPNPKVPFASLKSFRIQIRKLHYRPGDKVIGFFHFNLPKPKQIKSLSVHVVGHTKTIWSNGDSVYESVLPLIGINIPVFQLGQASKIFKFPAGCYRWQFSCTLPEKLPPSYLDKKACTIYHIGIKVNGQSVYLKPFTVAPEYGILNLKTLRPFRLTNNPLDIIVNVPEYIYIGEKKSFKFVVKNNTGKPIKQLQVRLYLYNITYGAKPESLKRMEYSQEPTEWAQYLSSVYRQSKKKSN